jgi:tetratricopeptide (TPR) repeat protein
LERPSYFEAMAAMLEYGGAPLDGVVAGREKFIHSPLPELYDIARDRAEATNLADTAGDRRRTLESALAAFSPVPPGDPRREDPESAARLRALGYTSSGAPRRARYGDDDDPKRLVEIDRAMHDAVALGEAGQLTEAIGRYRAVLAKRPALTAASRHLAFAYWRTGNAPAAIDALQSAIKASPDDAGVKVQLGAYLLDTGRLKEALSLLENAAATESDVDTLNALGLAYARANRSRDALAAWGRALSIDPDSGATLENIGAVQLDAGHLDLARAAFVHAVQSTPESSSAHAGLAMALIRTGDRTAAFAEWKQAVALDPSNFDALYDLGIQLARDNRMTEARPYLEQFARTAPPGPYAKELQNVRAILAATGGRM